MKLASKEAYLCLTYHHQHQRHFVRLAASFEGAVNGWSGYTRISPLWGVVGYSTAKPSDDDFSGDTCLLFLGPIHPSLPLKSIKPLRDKAIVDLWVGMGSYNFVVRSRAKECSDAVINWAKQNQVPFEHWVISNGMVREVFHSDYVPSEGRWRAAVMRLAKERAAPLITPLVQEYCALIATTLSRAEATDQQLFEQVSRFNERMVSVIRRQLANNPSSPDAVSTLTNVNAALSRFSSQAFSGISPITGTECHFWIHSLLGIGVANLAFARFVTFIHENIGKEKFDLKLKALGTRKDAVPSIRDMTENNRFINEDHISDIVLSVEHEDKPLVPLMTYFSGRDGYRSHIEILSAPLTAVWESISYRSSLLTTTHEIGHIFIQSVLAQIFPNESGEYTFKDARVLARPQYQSQNWLDAIRQCLLEAILAMEAAEFGRNYKYSELSVSVLAQLLVKWRKDTEETMVHVFDFIYFYGQDVNAYVRGIWHSWSAIPNITPRIPDYVKRTLCALLSAHFDLMDEARPSSDGNVDGYELDFAKESMVDVLKEIITSDPSNVFVRDALNYIESSWQSIKGGLQGRVYLVKLVVCFLHSEKFAKRLLQDPHRGGGAGEHQGYRHRVLELDDKPVGNPLRFIQAFTRTQTNAAESLWALTTIAFNLRDGSE